MKTTRTLALRREILTELSDSDLRDVAGGRVTETCFSCLTWVSCNPLECLLSRNEPDSCICAS